MEEFDVPKRGNGFDWPPSLEQIIVYLLMIGNMVHYWLQTHNIINGKPSIMIAQAIFMVSYVLIVIFGFLTTWVDPEDDMIKLQLKVGYEHSAEQI